MASAGTTDNRLVILKGDDTGGTFGRALVFTITTDGTASLDGCRAEWEFDGIVKRIDAPLVEGEPREVFYSHNETRCMRLGVRFGALRIIDAAGKVRTFDNTKPVEVTDKVSRVYPGSSAATVVIGSGVTWDGIAGKPKLVKTINGEEPDEDGNIKVASGGTVKSATVNGGEKVMPDASGNLALTVESVPSDYSTVRQNAATGAAHAAETGNPHETTAEQVGVRVVELVVEGDAKNFYLMLNGERTTERVTSYAALLAMAKRGLVRLYYNAVGGTGRKALYTAHMVDDAEGQPPTMRFDATGTLGEKVYTRSIAMTKSGEDGIAVSIGALTEIAKSADIDAKRDKTDNVCAKDEIGKWEFTGVPPYMSEVTDPEFNSDGWPDSLEGWKWRIAFVVDGSRYYDHADGDYDSTSLTFGATAIKANRITLAKSTESYVTPTGVENLTPKLTTTIAASSSGNAADAAAVKTAIDAATKLTPVFSKWSFSDGNAHTISTHHIVDDYFWIVDNADDYFPKNISDEDALSITFDPTGLLDPLTATRSIVGYKLGLKTAETDPTLNGMSVDDITTLAEAACKVNHNAESTAVSSVTLKDGDVASVTMSGTTLAIDFDDARATGGLRLCELYISGATKDADLTFAEGETVVTDGNAFPKCEAGLNYYVFAEVAPNTWNVTRKTLQQVIPAPTTEG